MNYSEGATCIYGYRKTCKGMTDRQDNFCFPSAVIKWQDSRMHSEICMPGKQSLQLQNMKFILTNRSQRSCMLRHGLLKCLDYKRILHTVACSGLQSYVTSSDF